MRPVQPDTMRPVGEVCRDEAEILALSILRMVMAGYATGDVACWDMAYAGAERHLHPDLAGRLVAALTTLSRAVRAERSAEWYVMPATCCRVTQDEAAIVALFAAARSGGQSALARAASDVTGRPASPLLQAAARGLACVLDEVAVDVSPQGREARRARTAIH